MYPKQLVHTYGFQNKFYTFLNISRSQLLRFQAPRGTVDILPDEQVYWRFFQSKANEVATKFGYDLIETPVFEDTGLFVRGIGEATDIVEKGDLYLSRQRRGLSDAPSRRNCSSV